MGTKGLKGLALRLISILCIRSFIFTGNPKINGGGNVSGINYTNVTYACIVDTMP